ncbi:MAG TPA: winged helix-turn-helix domain-containing protein [Solirubrobacterales bacterium]|nr:winged helix-turn-helix domain-containing protein [Solirubrobacterales bacterium]
MAAALLHPFRGRIMRILAERPATVRMLAGEMEEPADRVRKQLRWLEREGVVFVSHRLPRRGTAENYYRPSLEPVVDTVEFEQLSAAERARLSGDAIKCLYRDATHAVRAGTFDRRSDMASVHIRMLLDERGWRELAELHHKTALAALALRREALERLERSGDEPISAASTTFLFELPDLSDDSGR